MHWIALVGSINRLKEWYPLGIERKRTRVWWQRRTNKKTQSRRLGGCGRNNSVFRLTPIQRLDLLTPPVPPQEEPCTIPSTCLNSSSSCFGASTRLPSGSQSRSCVVNDVAGSILSASSSCLLRTALRWLHSPQVLLQRLYKSLSVYDSSFLGRFAITRLINQDPKRLD